MNRIKIVAAFVRENLREGAVRTEDGDYAVVCDYIVLAELADGSRYEHEVRFNGRCGVTEEEGFGYGIDGDKAAAEALAARVDATGSIDPAHWHVTEPCYGSVAYERNGCEVERAFWERREAGLR